MVNAKLVVVGGDARAAEVQLKLPTIIGRGKEASLTVPHALVSRQHTEIFERDGKLFVRDLGSLNGTFVNNLRIEDEQPLEPNQLLTLGNVTFRAVYEIGNIDGSVDSDTDSISFAQQETTTIQPKRQAPIEMLTPGPSVANPSQVNSEETVPIDSLPTLDSDKSQPNATVPPAAETVQATDAVIEPDSAADDLSADTDKSFKTTCAGESSSNIFSFEDGKENAGNSVSISALNDLPVANPAVSFVGSLEIEDEPIKPLSQIDPVELDLGSDEKKSNIDVDSSLGSFLKKLPR